MSASARPDGNRLALTGRVTADNAQTLRNSGEAWLASLSASARATVDLAAVTSASSVLLSLLLCLHRRADQQQVTLTLEHVSDELAELSRLNGVSRWLTGL